MKFISKSEKETYELAKKLTKFIKKGDTILLQGDLGAGKTTFVKSFVRALGGNEDDVTSPTFTIVNEYSVKGTKIYHMDLYRIENPNELYNIGIEDYLYSNAICFIEWAERAMEMFLSYKMLKINKISNTQREFIFDEE